MKETKTINMFGILYTVDADAYELLSRYLGEMRTYFAGRSGCGEITDDIECRIAELMEEYRANGVQSITIDNVREIISRIGRPEDFADNDDTAGDPDIQICGHQQPVEKKLFRDIDHKMLGGVFAGLGCYWNVNPLWFRILAILLAFGSFGVVTVLYVVAWLSIPAAVTPADRLQMKGESVNVENLTEQIMKDGESRERAHSGIGINSVLNFLCLIFKFGLLVCAGAFILWCTVMLMTTLAAGLIYLLSPTGIDTFEWGNNGVTNLCMVVSSCTPIVVVMTFVGAVTALSLTIFMIVHLILKVMGKVRPLSMSAKITCVIAWFIAVVVTLSAGTRMLYECATESRRLNEIRSEQFRNQSRFNETEFLKNRGWIMKKNEGSDHLVKRGEHYSGSRAVSYLDAYNSSGKMKYEAVKEEKVVPGTYKLTAFARSNGQGAEVFASTGKGRYATAIPADGNRGGNVWQEIHDKSVNDSLTVRERQNIRRNRRLRVNNGRGYGWNKMTVESITVGPDSLITYGVTNDSPTGYWNGTWVSACEFKLEKIN